MQSIQIRSLLSGDVFAIDYVDTVPSVATLRAQLEAQTIAGKRNHVLKLFRMPAAKGEARDDAAAASDDGGDSKEDVAAAAAMRPLTDEDTVTPEDELVMICEVERRMTDREIARVDSALRQHFGGDSLFDGFRAAVVAAGAVVAGGSITAIFGGFDINDIDLYVNFSKAQAFLAAMSTIGYRPHWTDALQMSSEYDQSFFRKNQILVRFPLESSYPSSRAYKKMDVMVIPDTVNVEDVVTNFDLSFCEVWWDGRAVFASDPHGVRHKEGILKPDYRRSLFTEFNPFIIKRLKKYTHRGYTIDTCARDYFLFDTAQEAAAAATASIFPSRRRRTENGIRPIADGESWAVKKFIRYFYREMALFLNSTGVTDRMSKEERASSPLSGRNRNVDLYFKTTDGQMAHRRAPLDANLHPEFVDLFATVVYHTQLNEFVPKAYHKFFLDIFPSVQTLHPCRVLRFLLFELSEHFVRICGDAFRPEWAPVAITQYNRLMVATSLGRIHPENNNALRGYPLQNIEGIRACFLDGCTCDDCQFIRSRLAAEGFPAESEFPLDDDAPHGLCEHCGCVHGEDDGFSEDDLSDDE